MSKITYIFNSPPLSLNKEDLYKEGSIDNKILPYIKAISDAFFLSNNFRKHLTVVFLTEIDDAPYQIVFKGSELRFLGPSFFSAAHLLLRAKNHILNPKSKAGKLTPGITVLKQDIQGIIKEHEYSNWYMVESNTTIDRNSVINTKENYKVFLFGFIDNGKFGDSIEKLFLRTLEIDEQVIIINYLIESVE